MATLNISLPEQMRQFIDEQVASGGYSTASEYLRELIRHAQKELDRARLEDLLMGGLKGEPIEVNDEYWEKLRMRLNEKLIEGLNSGQSKPMTKKDWDGLKDRIRRESSRRKSA